MYKRIKTKIDKMDGTSCRRVDSIYQILSKYENGNTTIDTVSISCGHYSLHLKMI